MDELDLLERFWEHIPEPDPGRVHVARSALMERIGTDPRLERLRRPRRRVSRRWAVSLVAAASVAIAIAVPVFPDGTGSRSAPGIRLWVCPSRVFGGVAKPDRRGWSPARVRGG
jgi:hypothetical protein